MGSPQLTTINTTPLTMQHKQKLRAPTLAEIERAAENIKGKAIRTPLVKFNSGSLNSSPAEIYLKLENLQPIGSFKVRPAANAIACIKDKTKLAELGVSTASAGNFAQGLAWCCKEMGVKCTVVAPDHAPEIKLSAIRAWGADVIRVPYAEWWEIIETHQCPQAPQGAVFIHPGAENDVLPGNATIAREIVEDLPDVDCIVVPYGSGAVCTGIACGIKEMARNGFEQLENCEVFAAEPDTAAPFALSMKVGKPVRFDDWQSSFVDGCGGKAVLTEIWDIASCTVSGGIAVPLQTIAEAAKQLVEGNKVVAEGAGACPVEAAMTGRCGPRPRKIVCVVSGGGIDSEHLRQILEGNVPKMRVPNNYEAQIEHLALTLPVAPEPKGNYRPATVVGNMLYTSGHGPVLLDGKNYMMGRVGEDITVEEAVQAARATGLAVLATLRKTLGSLDRVKRIVKTLGMVNANPTTLNQLECVQVINGFSNLMMDVFGPDNGVGARSAVGMATLPMNTPVEVEAIFEISPE